MKNAKDLFSIIGLFTLLVIFFSGCQEEFNEQEKYQPPKWLEGKIFERVSEESDLSTFARLIEKAGYDTLLNSSGSYTVFAPTDSSFDVFFNENPEYRAMLESDEAAEELVSLLEYQIIYNDWSEEQLQSLDVGGWIDPEDELSEPRAYKHQTLLRPYNKEYPAIRFENFYRIVPPENTNNRVVAYTNTNKYAPVFYNGLFDLYNLPFSDYEFYFNREFNPNKIYFAGAVMNEQIPAENGSIYKTDKVVMPLKSAEEIMEEGTQQHSYDIFLDMLYNLSELKYNSNATLAQSGAEQGLEVDSLFDVTFPDLVANIHNELTGNNRRFTTIYHRGVMAPTDQALNTFLSTTLPEYNSYDELSLKIKEVLVNSHMTRNPVYQSDILTGFTNGAEDSVMLDPGNIIQKAYGSNSTFIGLDKAIEPRVFNSVCRPLYVTRGRFELMRAAVEYTNLLSALKKSNANYGFYLPNDFGVGVGTGDSSLIRVDVNKELDIYYFEAYNMGSEANDRYARNDLRRKILNHIAVSPPRAFSASKEFLRTLGGNYLIVNHDNGTVSGTSTTKYGFGGDSTITIKPREYEGETDNGKVFIIDNFFNFIAGGGILGSFFPNIPSFRVFFPKRDFMILPF